MPADAGLPTTVQVDQVILESVADDSVLLGQARSALDLPDDFEVNNFENWLPSFAACNRTKGSRVWDPSLIVQQAIQKARDHAPQAQKIADDLVTDRKLSRRVVKVGPIWGHVGGASLIGLRRRR